MEQATQDAGGVLGQLVEHLSTTDLFGVPSGGMENIAYRWLTLLMPDGGNAFTAVLHAFSSALLILCSAVLTWHVLAGIVASAHEGKVLGQRWHQIWSPMRVVLGIALLVPAAPNGLSGIHFVVQGGALISINLADEIWARFVTVIQEDGVPIVPAPSGGRDLAAWFAESEACRIAMDARAAVAGDHTGNSTTPPTDGMLRTDEDGLTTVTWNWGQACGAVALSMPGEEANLTPAFAEERRKAAADVLRHIREARFLDLYIQVLGGGSGPTTDQWILTTEAKGALPVGIQVAHYFRDLGDWYDKQVQDAAGEEASLVDAEGRSKLVAYARQKGWLSAGLYWRNLSQTSELTAALAGDLPVRFEPDEAEWGLYGSHIKTVLDILHTQATGNVDPVMIDANDLAAAGDSQANDFQRMLAPYFRDVAEWTASRDRSRDPVGEIISFGHVMLTGAWGAIAAGGVAALAGSSLPGKIVGGDGAVPWFLSWVGGAILVMIIVGVVCAYVLVVIPMFYILALAMSWIVGILEAIISGPLLAASLIRMDGHDLIAEAQRPGVMALFAVVLRPVIGIIAFCGSFLVVTMALDTLNTLWGLGFAGNTGGHVVDPFGILAGWAISTYLAYQICLRSFHLTVDLPDRVGKWFGIDSSGYGESREGATFVGGAVSLSQQGVQQGAASLAQAKKPGSGKKDGGTAKSKASGASRRPKA